MILIRLKIVQTGAYSTGYKGIHTPPQKKKLDSTTDAEYLANLANANMWL